MANKNYRIDMCNGPIFKKLLVFSIPLMLSSVLQLLFNAADVIVVGRFAGSQSLAAVGSTGALINLIVNLFVGLSVGANVVVAKYYGGGRSRDIRETVHTSMTISIISGVLLAIFGVVASKVCLEIMATPYDVIELATLYLRIYFLGMPATMVYNFGSAILRAQGDTRRPLYFLSIAGAVNVLLNLVLVIVFKLDVAGVAIATVISQYISSTLIVICMVRDGGFMKLNLKKLRITRSKLLEILKIGLPAGLQGIIFSLSNVVIQSSVNSFGSTVMAGNSAAANIEGFVYVSMNACYQACITFTGQNVGAKKYERVNKILIRCQVMVIGTGVILGVGGYLAAPILLRVYSSDSAVIMAGINRMKYVCMAYALCGSMDVMVGSMRGMGYSVIPMVVSLLGACGFRLLWIATIFRSVHTMDMLYISYPISWVITTIAHIICFIVVRRNLGKSSMKALPE